MSSTSTEDEAPEKRRLQSPEEATGPAQWTVKRPRTGSGTPADINALVASTHELQRSERQAQAISPAPSAGQAAAQSCRDCLFCVDAPHFSGLLRKGHSSECHEYMQVARQEQHPRPSLAGPRPLQGPSPARSAPVPTADLMKQSLMYDAVPLLHLTAREPAVQA